MEAISDLDIMKIYNDSELKRNYTSLGRNGYIMFCRVCVSFGYRSIAWQAGRKNSRSPTTTRKKGHVQDRHHDSALNFSPPSPPRMISFMKEKKRSPYSLGGTGLILCLSAFNPFQIFSTLLLIPYGVNMSITPK